MSGYKVKNWARFQHYKDRNPPWIKLHWSLISSRDWVTLDDASRVLAIACMLIASRNEDDPGTVPNDPDYVQRVAYLNTTPDFKPLIDCGFLECASTMLADASKTLAFARPETETETETERDTRAPSRAAQATRLAGNWVLPDELRAWAIAEEHMTSAEVDREAAKFRDYWTAKGGKDGRKTDWPATWRNWIRRSTENRQQRQPVDMYGRGTG